MGSIGSNSHATEMEFTKSEREATPTPLSSEEELEDPTWQLVSETKSRKRKKPEFRRRPKIDAQPKADQYTLKTLKDGNRIIKIDKLVYVLLCKPNGKIVCESFTPSEFEMYRRENEI